jgi:DNA polymerase-3 subunit alpha
MTGFVHLRVHSEYSLVDSVVRVKPLLDKAQRLGMPALALTDQGNVSAMVKFYRTATRKGIKPIIGADVLVGEQPGDKSPVRLTLLCTNRTGFERLSALLTRSYASQHAHAPAAVLKDWLCPSALEGLIVLSGGSRGELGRALLARQADRARAVLGAWQALAPGRFYIDVQRVGRPGEPHYLAAAVQLAAAEQVPLVATNEVCFARRADFDAHETRVCIAQGRRLDDPERPRDYTEEQYLKSAAEMSALFADLPEALENTVEIAKRCNFELELGRVYLPGFDLPGGGTASAYLREQATARLAERLDAADVPAEQRAVYEQRLAKELDVICDMGFEGYFLIVADFILWAKDNAIPVGPGRGSGAGSLVAYVLGITNLDPIQHDLLFERFLNPERVSLPDFDVDFCIEGRDRVIDYVARRYGRDRVSQIATYGTMAARAVVRDVGRVLGMPYGYVDRIAKLIPFELGITLDKALADDAELKAAYEAEDDVRLLIDRARQLEGLARNAGTHAGGVVIAPAPLPKFVPLYADETGSSVTQLDMVDLEAIGLVKFDFLGLKTLTIIDKAMATINRLRASRGEPPIDIDAVGVDDPETYALLNACKTTAVFQLESRGMRDLIKRLQPDNFEDLVAINALFRPGPLQSGMVDDFIDRKHGRNAVPVDYLHPSLEPILKTTYGVILYQEQVMQIAQTLAGYSLGGADLLRRAMGKKKPEEMAKQRAVFLAGATERGIDEHRAAYIFDLMEKFAGYGFNKSHSAAYALIAYQTAWIKAHYPAAFMAAVMTADMDNTDKLVVLKNECKELGIELDPPHVNRSAFEFAVAGAARVSYGLGAIKGVGHAVVEAIVREREAAGPYRNLLDLCRRLGDHKLNRRVLEALVRAGALDGLGANRATMMEAVPDTLQLAERSALAQAAGQEMLFGPVDDDAQLEDVFTPKPEWNKRVLLEAERESLGLYLTGHPFDDYAEHCERFGVRPLDQVAGPPPSEADRFRSRQPVRIAGVVGDIRRRGNRITLELDDNKGCIEVTLFEEVFNRYKHLIAKHAILVADGQLRYDDFLSAWRLTASVVRTVDEAIEEYAGVIEISVRGEDLGPEFVGQLKETLEPYRQGKCKISVLYRGASAEAKLRFDESWSVRPTRELRERLGRLLGENRYKICYPKQVEAPSA